LAERTAKENVIHTPHLRLTAKQWGANSGLPVLGLHGWLNNANTFDQLAPMLPDTNLVSLDPPGHHPLHLDNPHPVAEAINRFLGEK
jgi:pimeloyl-ACP methyl ester carboxylesterase